MHESRAAIRESRARQHGLSFFGLLVVLALVAAAGYYIYTVVMETEGDPGCNNDLTNCMKHCRRGTTETAAAQKCQEDCQRVADECRRGASR